MGGEFQVNEYTTGRQGSAAVALAPGGEFFVVWTGAPGQDGSAVGVFGRRYDATGAPMGGELRVNEFTTGGQFNGKVAADGAGNFLVVWQGYGAPSGIMARRYPGGGLPGSEFMLSESFAGGPTQPALAMNPDGSFVATWSAFLDGSNSGIFARQFNAAGVGLAPAFAVNTYTTGRQYRSRVALTGGGAFTVVWHSDGQDGAGYGIFGRRIDATGNAVGSELQIHAFTTDAQQTPEIAADRGGGFLVIWERWGFPASPPADFVGRSFDASGVALDPAEFIVNTYLTSNQRSGSIASDPDGRFVVVWDSLQDEGASYSIRAQRFGDLIFKDGFD
jgi:hypothetical protein